MIEIIVVFECIHGDICESWWITLAKDAISSADPAGLIQVFSIETLGFDLRHHKEHMPF